MHVHLEKVTKESVLRIYLLLMLPYCVDMQSTSNMEMENGK